MLLGVPFSVVPSNPSTKQKRSARDDRRGFTRLSIGTDLLLGQMARVWLLAFALT